MDGEEPCGGSRMGPWCIQRRRVVWSPTTTTTTPCARDCLSLRILACVNCIPGRLLTTCSHTTYAQ
jgi:hypothetical protein